jgi:hypothetical protein
MTRRIALVTVWFLTGWMCAAMVAFAVGLPTWIAPFAAVIAATYIGLWDSRRTAVKAAQAEAAPTAALPAVAPRG